MNPLDDPDFDDDDTDLDDDDDTWDYPICSRLVAHSAYRPRGAYPAESAKGT